MGWRLARWYLLVALGCGLARPAAAQVTPQPVKARVNELRQQGEALNNRNDPEAIARFRAAWELSKEYIDLCNLGKVQLELGHERDAVESLSGCLKLLPDPKVDPHSSDFRKAVERYLTLARALVGALEIEANVPGAEVLVDGQPAGKLPSAEPIYVSPGWRTVEVRAPGFRPDVKRVEARAGASAHLRMQLAQIRPEVVPAGREQASPGQSAANQESAAQNRSAQPTAMKSPPTPPLSEAPRGENGARTGPLIAGIAMGIVGAGAGIGGVVGATTAYADANAARRRIDEMSVPNPCNAQVNRDVCQDVMRSDNQIAPLAALAVGGFLMAGAGGGLLFYELVRASSHKAKDNSGIAITVTPGPGALWVTGRF